MTTLFGNEVPRALFEPKKRQVKVFQDKFKMDEVPLSPDVLAPLEAEARYPYPHQVAAIGMMFPVPVPKDVIKDMDVPVQKDAGSHVILKQSENLVVSFETASGKTFLAKLHILKHVGKGTAFYMCPYKALAEEKYNELTTQFGFKYKIGIMTGDFYQSGSNIDNYDIIITTFQKLDSLLRNNKDKIAEKISCLVVDEIHFMDSDNGVVIDDFIAKIKALKDVPIMAMSATIGNATSVASWLGASLLESKFRPVPFKMGTITDGEIEYEDGTFEKAPQKGKTLEKVIGAKIVAGEQIMYVRQSRSNAESFAKKMKQELAFFVNNDMELPVIRTSEEEELNQCIKHGVAWHHSGLVQENRAYVEENFKNGKIRFICATTTLGAGINIPAKYVFLDWKRFVVGYGSEPLTVRESMQILHRAGRPQFDDVGYGIFVCTKDDDYDYCVNNYYDSKPEPIHSRLFDDANYLFHSIIGNVGSYAKTTEEIMSLYKNTFAYFEHPSSLRPMIGDVLRSFNQLEEPLVQESGGSFFLTKIGVIVKRYYVNPDDAMIIVKMVRDAASPSAIAMTHTILRCKNVQPIRLKDPGDYWHGRYLNIRESLFYSVDINDEREWRAIQTSILLLGTGEEGEIIYADEETSTGQLCYHYGILAGDLQRTVGVQGNFSWMIAFAKAVAVNYKKFGMVKDMDDLEIRIKYAVSNKIVQLCHIKGIGRERGKALFKIGYCDVESIASARLDDIADVSVNDRKIGTSLAIAIVQSAKILLDKGNTRFKATSTRR